MVGEHVVYVFDCAGTTPERSGDQSEKSLLTMDHVGGSQCAECCGVGEAKPSDAGIGESVVPFTGRQRQHVDLMSLAREVGRDLQDEMTHPAGTHPIRHHHDPTTPLTAVVDLDGGHGSAGRVTRGDLGGASMIVIRTYRRRPLATSRLPHGAQHTSAVGDRVEIGITCATGHFQARNLRDPQAGLHRADSHLGLDLEAGRLQIQKIQVSPMESAEAVTQIGQLGSVQAVEEREQPVVAQPPEPGDVE